VDVEGDLLTRIVSICRAFDETALEALASKGLLRRATKDLEKETVAASVAAGRLEVRVGSETVSIPPEGPVRATCTCPATGACRHILTAVLAAQKLEPQEAVRIDPMELESEVLAIGADVLEEWGGKKVFSSALEVLADNPAPEIDVSEVLRVHFRDSLVECRWFLGGGLDGAVTTSKLSDPRRFVVAMVLAFQRSRGRDISPKPVTALDEVRGAPRSRSEVLLASRRLLEEMLDAGLHHVAAAAADRFATLSLSAAGTNLPRLAGELRRIGHDVRLLSSRDAASDDARLFGACARAYGLITALEGAGGLEPELIGWHRTRYDEVGRLELRGLGAHAWRSASGFHGITVVFREETTGEWYTWSEARPEAHWTHEAAVARFTSPGPWEGMPDPRTASRSHFTLFHAKANQARRISSSSRTRAQIIGASELGRVELGARRFTSVDALERHLRDSRPAGLSDRAGTEDLVVVEPDRLLERGFDELRQRFVWRATDAVGREILVSLEHSSETAAAIAELEVLDPSKVSAVMGRARLAERTSILPFAVYANDEIQSLGLSGTAPAAPRSLPWTGDDSDEEEMERERGSNTVLRIRRLEALLEEVAEQGRNALDDARRKRIRRAAASMGAASLPVLERAGLALSEATGPDVARRLLIGRYLTDLHRRLAG
jgi:hypothetical protein